MERINRTPITRIAKDGASTAEDAVVVEEPLEIRLGEKPLCVTMRTRSSRCGTGGRRRSMRFAYTHFNLTLLGFVRDRR